MATVAVLGVASRQLLTLVVPALAIFFAAQHSEAQKVERSGKEIVASTCSTCHSTGARGAPRIGDNMEACLPAAE